MLKVVWIAGKKEEKTKMVIENHVVAGSNTYNNGAVRRW
jgi:hypothetical protein